MKRVIYLLFFIFLPFLSFTQIKGIGVVHYIFPEFETGTVIMKNGIKQEASLNYNSLTEEMIFENGGTKLALGDLPNIDTISIKGRKFIPLSGKFVEILLDSRYSLFAIHKCTLKDPGKPAGYGGTSQTAATSTYSSYYSGGQVYDLKLPEGLETKPFVEYLLKKDGQISKFISLRQLIKLFADKKDQIKEYLQIHEVNYDDQGSLIKFIQFLESN